MAGEVQRCRPCDVVGPALWQGTDAAARTHGEDLSGHVGARPFPASHECRAAAPSPSSAHAGMASRRFRPRDECADGTSVAAASPGGATLTDFTGCAARAGGQERQNRSICRSEAGGSPLGHVRNRHGPAYPPTSGPTTRTTGSWVDTLASAWFGPDVGPFSVHVPPLGWSLAGARGTVATAPGLDESARRGGAPWRRLRRLGSRGAGRPLWQRSTPHGV